MTAIILSGVGGSVNWLPLILPLVAILLILKFSETIIHFFKRKKLSHENHTLNDVSTSFEDVNGQNTAHD